MRCGGCNLYVMAYIYTMTTEQRNKLEQAAEYLTDWLMENTVEAFEEQPEIDNARTLIQEALS